MSRFATEAHRSSSLVPATRPAQTRRETMSKTTKEEALAKVKAAFGFVPNLMAGIADTNPAVATGYLGASAALEGGVLSPAEKQVVMLAVSSFNDCHYCTA